MLDSGCLFCKIIEGKIEASVVYRDDAAIAFLDVHPRAPGHTLVIPRAHWPTLVDVPESEIGPFFLSVKKVAEALLQSLSPDGLSIGVNHGAASGQEVGHLHVHIIPRFLGDKGGSFQSIVNNPTKISLEEIKNKILNHD